MVLQKLLTVFHKKYEYLIILRIQKSLKGNYPVNNGKRYHYAVRQSRTFVYSWELSAHGRVSQKDSEMYYFRITLLCYIIIISITNLQGICALLKHTFVTFLPILQNLFI